MVSTEFDSTGRLAVVLTGKQPYTGFRILPKRVRTVDYILDPI